MDMVGEYYKTKESVVDYIQLAKDVSGKQLIEKLEQVLPPNSVLLEIGSGPGTDWKILERSYNVTGSDNSIEFLNYLISEYPNGEFLELDAISLMIDKKFDGIYSNKVLHHLNDDELENSIKRQFEILRSNGIVCHSFWRGEGSEVFKGLFVNYHDEEDLRGFYDDYFKILLLQRYQEFEEEDSLLLIARRE
ncbi:MAG: class I SAM-dependent methyltransferase [Saprospiraceae bacterium]|nr:class I SAM-dependent methyltransferase [Saprospiraceae bacterium]